MARQILSTEEFNTLSGADVFDSEVIARIWLDETLSIEGAFNIAADIECFNGGWSFPVDLNQVAGALHILMGNNIFELMENDKVAWFARLGACNRITQALEATFPQAPCSITDPSTYETYSELFKDDCGCRPSGHITGAEAREWIAKRGAQQRQAA